AADLAFLGMDGGRVDLGLGPADRLVRRLDREDHAGLPEPVRGGPRLGIETGEPELDAWHDGAVVEGRRRGDGDLLTVEVDVAIGAKVEPVGRLGNGRNADPRRGYE